MKKLIIAAAAILAAMLVSGDATAITGSQANGLHPSSGVVTVNGTGTAKVKSARHRAHCRSCGGRSTCGGCGLYSYTTRYTTCGGCGYGGCGCPAWNWCGYGYGCGTGCGYYNGGWSVFGWLF